MNCSAVILAGGKGTRFLGEGPKCLARLPDGSTLLGRLIGQLAGIEERIVCCSLENVEAIRDAVGDTAKAVACATCGLGPLPALAEALQHAQGEWRLLVLGDIYFRTASLDIPACGDGSLLVGTSRSDAGSGWIVRAGDTVKQISYARTADATARWTGAFLFPERLVGHLAQRAKGYARQPLEAWVRDLIAEGKRFACVDVGEFVNVNSAEDYAQIVGAGRPKLHERDLVA